MSQGISFLRLSQIVRTKNSVGNPLLPISKSSWWAGVRSGKFPAPVKLGPRTTAGRSSEIADLIDKLGSKR